ncbi:ABC transporter ATP-binding protein [Deinococcus sp.]|uniref:ABC transporter ATP-binding protein n=1 Tax=Deinococcus sp. TaxID=47478 RepID=UPI0025F73704|nr:ABC transporter ATP-binding protein [Deinococcus sp.]
MTATPAPASTPQPVPDASTSPGAAPMVQLTGVSKRYALGDTIVTALDNVSLTVMRGEYVAIMGTSGSGKSTLLQILGALDQPTEGTYELEGHDITALGDKEQARIRNRHFGFVFQAYNLFPELTALDNVELPLTYAGVNKKERRERARLRLEQMGLSARERHLPAQMSGGEQQRVAIARALVTNPTLLLADEPTGNLNQEAGERIMELLSGLHGGGTSLIVVTHDLAVGARAKRLITVRDGQVVGDAAQG